MLSDAHHWRLASDAGVVVLGAGLMGHAIAAIFVAHGYEVVCLEPNKEVRDSLPQRVASVVAQIHANGAPVGSITSVQHPSELSTSIALVIEAVPESLELKQELLRSVGAQCPHAVLATNTSVYRVGDVGVHVDDPSRVIGTHWWNPPHLIPLVEVVEGPSTLPAITAGMMDLLTSLGKRAVHVRRDTPGFIGNRLQHALWREAMALVQEGVCDADAVDLVVRNSIGLRLSEVGPMENADFVGLDLTRAIHEYVFPALSVAQKPLAILDEAIAAGHLGAKSGIGFLEWPEGKREETARRLAARVKLLTALIDESATRTI